MCNCGNTITTSSVCSSCVPNDCACPIKDLSTDCIQYTGEDLPCTEIKEGTLMTEAFSQLDTYLCDLSTQLANSFSLISVGAGTRVYKGVDGIGRKEIRSIKTTNTILTSGLSLDNKEVVIGINTTVLGQFVQANQITYAATNIVTGTGAGVYESSTPVGNNVTFNFRKIKSTDSRVTVTEGPTDIDITLSANLAEATGTINYVSKFTGIHTLGNSSIFDDGTNVGINNINPTSKLVVDANTNAADGIVSRNLNTGTSAYSFVGAFSNAGEGGIDLRSNPSTHSSWPSTSWLNSSSEKTNGLIVNQAGANPIRFFTNGSEKVRITPAGFVGIGVPTPTKILDVNGDALIHGFTLGRGNGDRIDNLVFGFEALQSNTPVFIPAAPANGGTHNIAIGHRVLKFNTIGNANTAIGFSTMNENISGIENNAIGNGALGLQTTGDGNTANGFIALLSINGSRNTAMGHGAAWGSAYTALPLGTASDNTSIGYQSMIDLLDGTANTAVGAGASASTVNGTQNTAIGFASGGYAVATTKNTSVGALSLWQNVIGNYNTTLGFNTQATDFNECIVLGADASATASNQFVVGAAGRPAGAVTTETNTSTKVWNVVINGVPVKILLA